MASSPVHTIREYFSARVPDLDKFLPGFNAQVAEAAALAFYWRRLFPMDAEPFNLNEARLGELQKTLISLKMVVSAVPQMLAAVSAGASISKAQSGQDSFQFEDRVKYYQTMMKSWTDELTTMEQALGMSNMAAQVRPYRCVVQ